MFNLTNVEVDGKKKQQENKQINKENRIKLPPTQNKILRNHSVSDHVKEKQRNQITLKGEQRIGTLQGILEDMKQNKLSERIDQRHGKALLSVYERKITDNFNKLYEPNNNHNILKEINQLEKQKFLEQEIYKNEQKTYQYMKVTNALKYQIKQKKLQLNSIHQQTRDLETIVVSENQKELYQVNYNNISNKLGLRSNYKINQIVNYLQVCLQIIKNQIEQYYLLIKKIINHVKRQCKDYMRQLNFIMTQYMTNYHFHFNRKENLQNLQNKMREIQVQMDNAGIKHNLKFKDQMCDQLSEFEETRAVNEIYKHGEEFIQEQEIQIQMEKQALQEKQKQEKNKAFDKLRNERIVQEEKLKELQSDFDRIKQVTSGNIKKVSDIIQHKDSIINLNGLQIKTQDNLNILKIDINDLKDELKKLQLNKEYEEENYKVYELEADFLVQEKLTQNKEQNQFRLQKIIDDCSLLVSRILYQLQKDKKMNVQVNQEQISNLLSISGLKLERMLTMIYKKKRNFKIESINYEFNQERPPNYIGLNAQISKDAFTGFLNVDINKKDKQDEQDSVNSVFEDNFLKQERSILREKEKNSKEIKKKY